MKKINKLFTTAIIAGTLVTSTAYAGGFFGKMHHRGGDMLMPIERMIDHLDLSDEQESQAEEILKQARSSTENLGEMRHQMFQKIIRNSPDSVDYMNVVEQQAETISAKVKEKVIFMATVRQDIYKILTSEQKEEMEAHIEKRMKRMRH